MTAWCCAALAVWAFTLAGCQTVPSPVLINAVPVYATSADARAVSAGQSSVVPIYVGIASEMEVLAAACVSTAAQVRLPTGKLGWVPINSLPTVLKDCHKNPPPNTVWMQF